MTKEEAQLFFTLDETECPEDQWETVLFEYKQFFLTRPVVAKVFMAKLKKLQKQYVAYTVLTDSVANNQTEKENQLILPELEVFDSVEQTFQSLFTFRSTMKQRLLRSDNVEDLAQLVTYWLEQEYRYQALWKIEVSSFEAKELTISKEKDPMILLSAIKKWDNGEKKDFKTLKQNLNDLPETLLDEVKRLSLLSKLNV